MKPDDIQRLLISEAKESILTIATGDPIAGLGHTFDDLGEFLQALAITYLSKPAVKSKSTNEFRNNLIRSGYARRYFLKISAKEKNDSDRYLAPSLNEALFDTLVAGDLNLAKEIVELSTHNWNKDWEHPDDHWYRKFIGVLLIERVTKKAGHLKTEEALRNFAAALGATVDIKYQICHALSEKDATGFAGGLSALLAQIQQEYDKRRELMGDDDFSDEIIKLRSSISIEGLALIRLADLSGIKIKKPFPLCPQDGLLPLVTDEIPDLFAQVDSERRRLSGAKQ